KVPQRARLLWPSGCSARRDLVARRRGDLPEMAVLKEGCIAGEQEPGVVARDTELRDVFGPDRREASDRVPAIANDGLEEEFVFAIAEQDPRVSAVLRSRRDSSPDDEIGINA